MSEVVVEVIVDSSGAVRGARKASRAVSEVGDSGGRLNKTLGVMKGAFAALALGVVASAFGRLAKQIFETVTAADDAAQAFSTTFGASARGLAEDLEATRVNAGLTKKELYDLASTSGAVAQGLGLSQAASADLSKQVVEMAADFQSFKNIPIDQAAHAITSALTGEREALKSLGVVVRETDVQKRALADTGKTNAKQLTDEEKAAATMTLIYERMGVVAGDLERTKDSLQNKVRRLKGSIREAGTEIARRFTPALESIVDAADRTGKEFGGPFTQALGDAADAFGELVRNMDNAGVFGFVASMLLKLTKFATYAMDAFSDFGSNVLPPLRRGVAALVESLAAAVTAFSKIPGADALFPGLKQTAAEMEAFAETQREIAEQTETDLAQTRLQRVVRRALAGATNDLADATETAAEETEDLSDASEKAASALGKAAKQVAEYRARLAELQGPHRERIVGLQKEAYELERALRLQEALIDAQARGVQKIDPRGLNEMLDRRVRRGAAEGDLRDAARAEDGPGGEVPVVELIGTYEDATISAAERMAIAARELGEEWGAVGEALAGTFGSIGDAMLALFEVTGQKSRAAFLAYKAFAIGEAIASTFLAANKALASGPPPWNIAQAVAITGIGLANVAKIVAARPGGGASGGTSSSGPSGSGRTTGRYATPGSSIPGNPSAGDGAAAQPQVKVEVEVKGESRIAGDDIRTVYNKASERYGTTRG